jgi:hypothetical protein
MTYSGQRDGVRYSGTRYAGTPRPFSTGTACRRTGPSYHVIRPSRSHQPRPPPPLPRPAPSAAALEPVLYPSRTFAMSRPSGCYAHRDVLALNEPAMIASCPAGAGVQLPTPGWHWAMSPSAGTASQRYCITASRSTHHGQTIPILRVLRVVGTSSVSSAANAWQVQSLSILME